MHLTEISPAPANANLAAARLLVLSGGLEGKNFIRIPAALQRWRAWAANAPHNDLVGPVLPQITDLQGRSFFIAAEPKSVFDVPLPAGTYHITVRLGGQQRRYTLTLQQGATFILRLRHPPPSR